VVRRRPNEVTELRQPVCLSEQLSGRGIVQSEPCGRKEVDRFDRAVPEPGPFVVLVCEAGRRKPRCELFVLLGARDEIEISSLGRQRADDEQIAGDNVVDVARKLQ
jgi:hypothetical protein